MFNQFSRLFLPQTVLQGTKANLVRRRQIKAKVLVPKSHRDANGLAELFTESLHDFGI